MPDKNGTSAPESAKEPKTQDAAADSKASTPSAQAAPASAGKASSKASADKKTAADKQGATTQQKSASATNTAASKKVSPEKSGAQKRGQGTKSQAKASTKGADKSTGKSTASSKKAQSKKDTAGQQPGVQGVRATAKYVRVAPRKARLVIDLIRYKPVEQATELLQFSQRAVAVDVEKVLRSACANAFQNRGLRTEDLIVTQAFVDEGPTLKRIRPRAKGSASRINKRTSHITVVVAPRKEA